MSRTDTARVRDPALGLLDRLVRDALDQGYVDAAARRAADPAPDRRPAWSRHAVAALGLLLVVALVTVAAVDQVAGAPDAAARKHDLAAEISSANADVDALESQVRATSAEVAALQQSGLGAGTEGRQVQDQLDRLGPAVGTDAVTGPGLVITMDDAPAEAEGAAGPADPELGRVLDRDLQHVVNGLWQAGAEAVDVNGQRLTSLSAIRGAGDAVLVNYRPLVRPYVVTAIGDPETLQSRFTAGPAGVELDVLRQTYGIRYQLASHDQVTLPGEPGAQLHEAREAGR